MADQEPRRQTRQERRPQGRAQEDALSTRLEALVNVVRPLISLRDPEAAMQAAVEAAREIPEAQYAALAEVDASGSITAFWTSGITPEERAAMGPLPQGRGLLGARWTADTFPGACLQGTWQSPDKHTHTRRSRCTHQD